MRTQCFILKSFLFSADGINTSAAESGKVEGIPADLVQGLADAGYLSEVSAKAVAKIIEQNGEVTVAGVAFFLSDADTARLVDEIGLAPDDLAPYLTAKTSTEGAGAVDTQASSEPASVPDPVAADTASVNDSASAEASSAEATVLDQPAAAEEATTTEVAEASADGNQETREEQRAVTIPEGWRDLVWNDLAKLAASVSSTPITNKKSAVAAIEAELQLRAEGK